MPVRIFNEHRNTVVAERAGEAHSFLSRLRGLLGRPPLPRGGGLVLYGTKAVHMMGMSYAIDVIFLNPERCIIYQMERLRPWRATPVFWNAAMVLELPEGAISASLSQIGDRLRLDPLP